MRCPKCGYENKEDAGACLMCYAMLKPTQGEIPPLPPKTEVFYARQKEQQPAAQKIKTGEKGFISSWWATLWKVLKSPTEFFNSMSTTGGLGEPYVFSLINMLVFGLGLFFLILVTGGNDKLRLPPISGLFVVLFLIVFLFISAILSLTFFVNAGVLNICAKLLLGKGNYEGTFRWSLIALLSMFLDGSLLLIF